MTTARYKFRRSKNSITGFLSTNTVNTDAFNVISSWVALNSRRSFNILNEEDEELIVEITWHESDDLAGVELDDAATSFGIERVYIQN